jgi:surfeit locus 1 family protein
MSMAAPRASRPRWLVLIAAVSMAALTVRLGVWQMSRAAQKEALQAQLDARGQLPALSLRELPLTPEAAAAQHHRPARLQGEWVPGATVFLDNRQMNGRPGFFVATPLKLAGTNEAVLVQRGWAPRDAMDRLRVPSVPTPAGPIEVDGRLAPSPPRLYDFAGPAASGPIRQNLDLADFARETGLALRPFSLLQADSPSTAQDGLLRQWPLPAVDVHKHYGYAFQWFALSALVAGLYVWFQLVRPQRKRRD